MKRELEDVVTPGEIRVDSVVLVLDTPDVRVWHINLDSKYAQVLAYDRTQVLLMANEDTLRTVRAFAGVSTSVKVDVPDDDDDYIWMMLVDCARYTCVYVAYRMSKHD